MASSSVAPLLPALALAVGLAGCSGETKGQVVLALQTDMSLPEDISMVKIKVKAGGTTRHNGTYILDPDEDDSEQLPATLAVVAGEEDNETVELTVTAFRSAAGGGFEARTLNKTVTTIPTERIATLHVPMQWLCTGELEEDEIEEGEYRSTCPRENGKERACIAGSCKDVQVNSADLPNFNPDDVFGGSEEGSDGTCFPTEECFDVGEDLVPDDDCVVTFDPVSDEILNFAAMATTGGIGDCRASGGAPCYVGLDKSQLAGWYELHDDDGPPSDSGEGDTSGSSGGTPPPSQAPLGRRFQLPTKVCERMRPADPDVTPTVVGVRVSTSASCVVTKTSKYPTCGPWSSVGKKGPPPEDEDADGDGVPASEDCDDDDNTVYPGAPEACDELDNDCDDLIDDACLEDLPFSHRVDFSALEDGFTSSENYAIYQEFDVTKPLDLDRRTITFTPGPEGTHYLVRSGSLDWDDDLGEIVPETTSGDPSNCDDCYSVVPLEFPFNYYGTEYTSVYPSSNGYLTFGVGDHNYTPELPEFLGTVPRIAALWADLDTRGPDGTIDDAVYYYSSPSKLVVTYQDIQIYSLSGTTNTFQFVLLDDGTIKISYDGMTDLDEQAIAGITPGSVGGGVTCDPPLTACDGSCVDLENDYFNCGTCSNFCASGYCIEGVCDDIVCPEQYIECDGSCVHAESDPDHCGACNNACGSELCLGGTCAPDTLCNNASAPCSGLCVGSCRLDTPAPCDGLCYGTCSGTCDTEDTAGNCQGTCDGDCTGDCTLSTGGQCNGLCTGGCYVDTVDDCGDPTLDVAMGPCTFSIASVSPGSCTDYAYSFENYDSWYVQCAGDECLCCRTSSGGAQAMQVCVPVESTPETTCASENTLRQVLVNECMQNSPCGAGCPGTATPRGTCDETEVVECNYATAPGRCMCMGSMYVCQ